MIEQANAHNPSKEFNILSQFLQDLYEFRQQKTGMTVPESPDDFPELQTTLKENFPDTPVSPIYNKEGNQIIGYGLNLK